ncbi:MAG: hypothetical protein IT450_13105 [Phycisphaerales bacterium]|nr:hypothetical protein [Phycisphaerales bacterium]
MLELACSSMLASGEEEVAAAFFITAGAVACFTTWVVQWRKRSEAAYNARLKQMMIERGMTADEIERVVASGSSTQPQQHKAAWWS